jgi:hypothetical protein
MKIESSGKFEKIMKILLILKKRRIVCSRYDAYDEWTWRTWRRNAYGFD